MAVTLGKSPNRCNVQLEQQSIVHHRKYPLFTFNIYLDVKGIKMLPSTLHDISPMPLQSLKVLRSTVLEKMHLFESKLFDLDIRVKVT